MAVAWAVGAWATNSWVGMNAGPPNAWRGADTPPPVVVTTQGGGDSTRLRKRGRRPKYFWEAALAKKAQDKVAEAVFDAVADAYLIESDSEFFTQVKYLQKLEKRLEEVRYAELAHQVELALKDLAIRAEQRMENARLALIAAEESELRELMEIGAFDD